MGELVELVLALLDAGDTAFFPAFERTLADDDLLESPLAEAADGDGDGAPRPLSAWLVDRLALEDVRRCVLTEEAARDAQDAHDAWQLAHDPAIPMFAKWYGEEWAREFAETVLFPGARERLASS